MDLLQQALTNSGLSNGNAASSVAVSSATLPESVSASDGTNKDVTTTVADVSSFNEPSTLASSQPAKLGFLSTMAVHDSVTGIVRRHPIRKVCVISLQFCSVTIHNASCNCLQ